MNDQYDPLNSLQINDRVRIPYTDLVYRYTRSGGPGGQHTNKTETAVELVFDLARTAVLTDDERTLAQQRLSSYLGTDGVLHLESQSERSQLRNREEVTQRFAELLRKALVPARRRRVTKPSRAVREQRLAQKRRTSVIKSTRRRPSVDE